jgi:hypothetical protein
VSALRDEPAGLLHEAAVLVAEARDHPAFLVPGEDVIQRDHDGPERRGEETRPEDRKPDARHGQRQVLRVTYLPVEAARRRVAAGELVEVDLPRTNQEHERPADEEHRPGDADGHEEGVRRHHHVRQEEGG